MAKIYTLDITMVSYLLYINTTLILILIVTNIINSVRLKNLYRKYNDYMVGSDGKSIENLIRQCLQETNMVTNKNKDIEKHLNEIDRNSLNYTQKTAIVRYNAFDDVGSDLSYSIALLDGNDNGIVITSLFTRDYSTTYGKPISGGKSKYPLSAEEIKVLDIAIKKYRESLYV